MAASSSSSAIPQYDHHRHHGHDRNVPDERDDYNDDDDKKDAVHNLIDPNDYHENDAEHHSYNENICQGDFPNDSQ